MTENQAREQASARGREREAGSAKSCGGQRNLDLTDQRSKECRKSKSCNSHVVDLKDLARKGLLVLVCLYNQLCSFLIHVCLGKLRDQLNEENNANYTEDIRDSVSDRYQGGILGSNGRLCRGERGS